MRASSVLWGSFAVLASCSVDYEVNQAEFEKRLCDREVRDCTSSTGGSSGSGSGGATGTGGNGGSSTGGALGSGGAATGGTGGASTGGGGGATAGSGGSVGADAGPLCTTGDKRCSNEIAEACIAGEWVQTPCTGDAPMCEGGVCVVCRDGAGRCSGDTPETCSGHAWQSADAACTGDTFCQGGECVTPPSCASLLSDCGPTASDTCCRSLLVSGGTFYRSHDGAAPATVSDFLLDKYEVTVGRFRKFVAGYPGNMPAAGAGAHPKIPGSGWDPAWTTNLPVTQNLLIADLTCSGYATWTDAAGAREATPLNCLTWYLAFAFCAWDGGRLPTEAEWNYAAAGGSEQRLYPWGDTAPTDLHAAFNCQSGCGVQNILPAGSKPDGNGKWGHSDLGGNLWEMNLDVSESTYPVPCVDCANVAGNTIRVLRGGAFNSQSTELLTASRNTILTSFGGSDRGFRCARTP